MNRTLAALTLAAVITGCTTQPQGSSENEPPVLHYSCGPWQVSIGPASAAAMKDAEGQNIQLKQVVSGSGALYKADEATWVHEKGGALSVSYQGAQLPECQPLLTSKEWVVEDIDGKGVVDSSMTSLNFGTDGRLSGAAGCNRFFAGYRLDGRQLEINQAATTMMACPEALMQQERRFLNALEAVDRLEIDAGGALILSGKGHRILAR